MAPTIAAATIYVLCAVPSGLALLGFVSERGGQPNRLLVGGVGEQTGQFRLTTMLADLDPAAQAEVLRRAAGPTEFINLAIQPASLGPEARAAVLHPARDLAPGEPSRVYLLGDATPLYLLGATGDAAHAPVIYHTTWDRSPLGDAIRAAPDGPAAWTAHLRARGIGFVLVNFDELGRLIALDRNFDPDVTLERIATWLTDPGAGCVAVHAWPRPGAGPGTGGALFRLFPPAAERAR